MLSDFPTLASLAVGAALGATVRHYTTLWALERLGPQFPYGTLLVNLAGSFLLGFFLALSQRVALPPTARPLIVTGFCGGLTTFSTFSAEIVTLLSAGRHPAAALYLLLSVGAGLLAMSAGLALGNLSA